MFSNIYRDQSDPKQIHFIAGRVFFFSNVWSVWPLADMKKNLEKFISDCITK